MLCNIISLFIIFSLIFVIIFLVFKSDCVTIKSEDFDELIKNGYSIKIKIYKRRRGYFWKRKSSKAK